MSKFLRKSTEDEKKGFNTFDRPLNPTKLFNREELS